MASKKTRGVSANPAFAKRGDGVLELVPSDKELLDFLDSKGDAGTWVCRQSERGPQWRLYQGSSRSPQFQTVREAIADAMRKEGR